MGGPGVARNRFSPPAASGGGGGAAPDIQDEGILIVPAATFLNFIGAGVTVTPNGAGADVTIPGGGGSTGLNFVVEHTVTALELAAKQFNLPAAPASPLFADMIGGGPLSNGSDFNVVGLVFDWNGLGLDGIINQGDVVRIGW